MLMPPKTASALLPARSVHRPLADWLNPSPSSVTGSPTCAGPERPSVHSNLTATLLFVHAPTTYGLPAAVANGVTVGAVLSNLMVSVCSSSAPPALSVEK